MAVPVFGSRQTDRSCIARSGLPALAVVDAALIAAQPAWTRSPHSTRDHRHRELLLIESARAFRRKAYHRQKLHLVLAGIRQLARELGDRVTVIRAGTYREGMRRFGRQVVVHEPGKPEPPANVSMPGG